VRTRRVISARAHDVDGEARPITEFEKLEGCVTCLSVRVRDE